MKAKAAPCKSCEDLQRLNRTLMQSQEILNALVLAFSDKLAICSQQLARYAEQPDPNQPRKPKVKRGKA